MSRGVLLASATVATAAADDVAAAEGLMSRGFALASACGEVGAAWQQCLANGWEASASWLVGGVYPSHGFLIADALDEVWRRESRSQVFHHVHPFRAHLAATGESGRLTMTNGVFDLLHIGHVRSLRAARCLGDMLVVAVNSDQSAALLRRVPAQREFARAELVAALKSVDYVVLFDEPDPREVIAQLRPPVLVKGGDYHPDQIAGGELLAAWGGQVVVTSYELGQSSSTVARNARRRESAADSRRQSAPTTS